MNTTIEEKRRLSSDFLFHLFSISKFFDPLMETKSYVFKLFTKCRNLVISQSFLPFPLTTYNCTNIPNTHPEYLIFSLNLIF